MNSNHPPLIPKRKKRQSYITSVDQKSFQPAKNLVSDLSNPSNRKKIDANKYNPYNAQENNIQLKQYNIFANDPSNPYNRGKPNLGDFLHDRFKDQLQQSQQNQAPSEQHQSFLPPSLQTKIPSIDLLHPLVYVNKQRVPIADWDPLIDTDRHDLNRLPNRFNGSQTFEQWYIEAIVKNTALEVMEQSMLNPFVYKDIKFIDTYRYFFNLFLTFNKVVWSHNLIRIYVYVLTNLRIFFWKILRI